MQEQQNNMEGWGQTMETSIEEEEEEEKGKK